VVTLQTIKKAVEAISALANFQKRLRNFSNLAEPTVMSKRSIIA